MMGIEAKVIADSIANGIRLTTMQVRFHRFVLAELNTHRMFSRNFSSSRAIPVAKMLEQVHFDPAMPVYWGKNKAGMQADEEIDYVNTAYEEWLCAATDMRFRAEELNHNHKVHKQIVNRLLEPFQWVNGVITATEWDNFFRLRDHPAAQPEIQELARKMKQAMDESTPLNSEVGLWHLPYINNEELYLNIPTSILLKCSAARCARASYNKHDGTSPSIEDDLELYNQLVTRPYTDKRGFMYSEDDPIHASPCEHQAIPMKEWTNQSEWEDGVTHMTRDGMKWSGNLRGWKQHRQLL